MTRTTVGANYEVHVYGALDADRSSWFAEMDLTWEVSMSGRTTTTLTGYVPDQAALHGVLARIRDLNLTLLLVKRLGNNGQ